MRESTGASDTWTALVAVGSFNLVQNLLIPTWAYVPANLMAASLLIALARRGGVSVEDLGLAPAKLGRGLRLGLLTTAGIAVVVGAALAVPATRRFFVDQRAIGHHGAQIAYRAAVRFPLGTALFEEMAFRGTLFALFTRRMSVRRATTAAAITFGLWHLIPAYQALEGNPLSETLAGAPGRLLAVMGGSLTTALSSYPLTWLRLRSGSLAAPWLAHAATNSLAYLAGVWAANRS